MTRTNHAYIGLDIGERRIGVAQANGDVKIAFPLCTIDVDGLEMNRLREIVGEVQPEKLIIGFPRNQSGEATAQTEKVKEVAKSLESLGLPIVFQDESLTSVLAEEYLKKHKKHYSKADIDAHAAAIILGDYIEGIYGH